MPKLHRSAPLGAAGAIFRMHWRGPDATIELPAGARPVEEWTRGGLATHMEKSWLSHYPPGVPHDLQLDAGESLVDMFESACADYAVLPAFTNFGRSLTYAELEESSARLAGYLTTRAGLERGDRVAIMMPNLLQYPVALFGVLRAGLVIVNVNPLYTPHELVHQLKDSGARAIIVATNSAATLAEIVADTSVEAVIVTQIGDLLGFPKGPLVNFALRYIRKGVKPWSIEGAATFREVLRAPRKNFRRESLAGADLACLQYTGGTTGRSKGAMLSHGNLVANVRQVNAWFDALTESRKEIVITALPLYHVYALTCNCLCYLTLGARNILITDPRDTKGFVAELKKWRFTAITGVNTLYQSLVNHPRFSKLDFSALKLAAAGGMAAMEDTANQWFRITGTHLLEGYGLSETSPVVASNPVNVDGFTGSIGLPLPSTEISLRDDAGKEVPNGEPGELCVRGPQVMSGYWNDPQATADAMTDDGFLKTGDIATIDARGFFRIVDRKKDMILVSGFNVYPNEVEDAVMMHPDVVEAACVGVKNEKNREMVKLFVVLRPGADVSAQDIRAFCKETLASYKIPKLVEFRSQLPKSPVGKILRRELREEPA